MSRIREMVKKDIEEEHGLKTDDASLKSNLSYVSTLLLVAEHLENTIEILTTRVDQVCKELHELDRGAPGGLVPQLDELVTLATKLKSIRDIG